THTHTHSHTHTLTHRQTHTHTPTHKEGSVAGDEGLWWMELFSLGPIQPHHHQRRMTEVTQQRAANGETHTHIHTHTHTHIHTHTHTHTQHRDAKKEMFSPYKPLLHVSHSSIRALSLLSVFLSVSHTHTHSHTQTHTY